MGPGLAWRTILATVVVVYGTFTWQAGGAAQCLREEGS